MTGSSSTKRFTICLFVAGDAPSSRAARGVIDELLGSGGPYEVVDVLREPERALEARLIATPTLIVDDGEHVTRYVGDLRGRDDLARALGVSDT